MREDIKKVHVIYKTHLDLGYTNMGSYIINRYMKEFIPEAIELALDKQDSDDKFVWTTGSWLISEYLRKGSRVEVEKMEEAIKKGLISWHLLPLTFHTELLDQDMLEYAISIGKDLDKRFGRDQIAAKMTDVPGHTIAMLKTLAKNGIKYLHLGVNPASTPPSVPNLFRWIDDEGNEIIVNYAGDYGGYESNDNLDEAMFFVHTSDNTGAPSDEYLEQELNRAKGLFPNAKIEASTLDAFAKEVIKIKDKLPIIREEIGDSWIYGVGSSPERIALYRLILRKRREWKERGINLNHPDFYEFNNNILMIPEHTWGLDEKKFLGDFKSYKNSEFKSMRRLNYVQKDVVPEAFEYIAHAADIDVDEKNPGYDINNRSFNLFESSWQEQDNYIYKAIEAIKDKELKKELIDEVRNYLDIYRGLDGEELEVNEEYTRGNLKFKVLADGSFEVLELGNKVISSNYFARLTYEYFGQEDYDKFFDSYLVNRETTAHWSEGDFGKPGLHIEKGAKSYGQVEKLLYKENKIIMIMSFDTLLTREFGAPKRVEVVYDFTKESSLEVDLIWLDKGATRIPEALWFSFNFDRDKNDLLFEKLGKEINPMNCVDNSGRLLHAIGNYVKVDNKKIYSLDAPLCSPYEMNLLNFHNNSLDTSGGVHFNLFNNCWGTNFSMWYEKDTRFRFRIEL